MLDVFATVRALGFPPDDYLVIGSATMAARGIRETDDLDILVSPRLFAALLDSWELDEAFLLKWQRRRLVKDNIELYEDLYWEEGASIQTLPDLTQHIEHLEGIPFVSLGFLARAKRNIRREKDLSDLALIEEYLGVSYS